MHMVLVTNGRNRSIVSIVTVDRKVTNVAAKAGWGRSGFRSGAQATSTCHIQSKLESNRRDVLKRDNGA